VDAREVPGDAAVTALLARHWRLVAVLAAAVASFGRSYAFPFSLIDDRTYVLRNPLVADPLAQGLYGLLATPQMGYPHTVTVLSFALDYRLFGTDPAGYHVVNVLLHLAAVTAVYVLMLRLDVERRLAGTAVALFALHPLVAEPICWVIGRKDILATGLLVGAMAIAAGSRHARPAAARIAAVVGVTAMAMLAKPSTILAPLVLWPFLRAACPAWQRRDVVAVVAATALAAGSIAAVSLLGLQAQGAFVERTPLELLVDPLRAATLQLTNLVWPRGLVAEYYRVSGDPPVWAMLLVLAAGAATAAWAVRRTAPRSIERLGFVLFAITFLPASGVLPTAHWSADSYFYLPLVWVTLVLATVVPRHWPDLFGFPVVAAALAVLSVTQARTWSSAAATMTPVAARYPDEPRALNRLAFALAEEGNRFAAASTFVEIEERFPDFPFNRGQRASAFEDLGDRRRAEEVWRLCIRDRDSDCAARYWFDVLNGRRSPRDSSSEIVGGTFEVASGALEKASSPGVLRAVAAQLRAKKLELLARRADEAAIRKERESSGAAVASPQETRPAQDMDRTGSDVSGS
jgi:hypothetical protein